MGKIVDFQNAEKAIELALDGKPLEFVQHIEKGRWHRVEHESKAYVRFSPGDYEGIDGYEYPEDMPGVSEMKTERIYNDKKDAHDIKQSFVMDHYEYMTEKIHEDGVSVYSMLNMFDRVTKDNYMVTPAQVRDMAMFFNYAIEDELNQVIELYNAGKISRVKFDLYVKRYESAKRKINKMDSRWESLEYRRELMKLKLETPSGKRWAIRKDKRHERVKKVKSIPGKIVAKLKELYKNSKEDRKNSRAKARARHSKDTKTMLKWRDHDGYYSK